MKESINEIILDEKFLKICRDKTLEVTGIDVFRKYKYKVQFIVDARTCFIGCLNSLLKDKQISDNSEKIGNSLHIDRSTLYVHRKNIIANNNISKELLETIDEIKTLVSIEILNSFVIPNSNVLLSIEHKLTDYIIYLNEEKEKANKLLQTLRENERKIA
jgi:hypothetical protein